MNIKLNCLLPAVILVMAFTSCGNPGGYEEPVPGKLTITNLPAGLRTYDYISVNSSASVTWESDALGAKPPSTWNTTRIGYYTSGSFPGIGPNNDHYIIFSITNGPAESFKHTGSYAVHFELSDADNNKTRYGVNNVTFTNGQATLDWAAFGFALPSTTGEFKLTGASSSNGKYAIVFGAVDTTKALYGMGNAVSATALKGFKIMDGTATIPMYFLSLSPPSTNFQAYSGSDTVTSLVVIIMDSEDFDYSHYAANAASYHGILYAYTGTDQRVTFSSGKAEKAVSGGTSF